MSDEETKYVLKVGATRVRRARAMELLAITDERSFGKVVDCNPQLCHRLGGEGQTKYLTVEIFRLLNANPRCAPVSDNKRNQKSVPKSKAQP